MKDARFAKNSGPKEFKAAGPSELNNIIFVKEDRPVEEEHIVAAFKRPADGETLTKQQRMPEDIDVYTKMQAKSNIAVRTNPDFPIIRKAPKKSKKSGKKSTSKMLIAELGKRVEKYGLISSLAQAQAGFTFGYIACGDVDFPENELHRIVSGKMDRAQLYSAGKNGVHGVSISRHLLVRVQVYSKYTTALFESGTIPNVMSHKMVKKLHLRVQSTNRSIGGRETLALEYEGCRVGQENYQGLS